jgi:hypothetical protein
MNRINLFRTASFRNTAETLDSVSCAKTQLAKSNFDTTGALIFAALLIACSLTVGCSSEQPKPISSSQPNSNHATYAANRNHARPGADAGRASGREARTQESCSQSACDFDLCR